MMAYLDKVLLSLKGFSPCESLNIYFSLIIIVVFSLTKFTHIQQKVVLLTKCIEMHLLYHIVRYKLFYGSLTLQNQFVLLELAFNIRNKYYSCPINYYICIHLWSKYNNHCQTQFVCNKERKTCSTFYILVVMGRLIGIRNIKTFSGVRIREFGIFFLFKT